MRKKIIWIVVAILLIGGAAAGGYFYFNNQENKSFTAEEERWIEKNKNNVINIYLPRDIAGFTYLGEGVFFDFLEELKERTEISFKEAVYDDSEDKEYVIEIVDKPADNQIAIFEDNYVLLTKENVIYTFPSEMKDFKVGVVEDDQESVANYLKDSTVEVVPFESEEALLEEFAKEDSSIQAIAGLRTLYLDDILENDYHVAYHLLEMSKTYVLTLNGDKVLNDIVKKTYQSWSKSNFQDSYRNHLLDTYFDFKEITEKQRTALREKAYVYAFIENGAYDNTEQGNLNGINYYLIKSFAEFANIDMEYKKEYANRSELVKDFEQGKIDFFFGDYANEVENGLETVAPIPTTVVVLASTKENAMISSIESLHPYSIATIKDSKIEAYLKEQEMDVTSYDSMKELLKNKKKDMLLVMDLESYEFYKKSDLAGYNIRYTFSLESHYGYIVTKSDELFKNLFDFYLEYTPVRTIIGESYEDVFVIDHKETYYLIAIVVLSIIVVIELLHDMKRIIHFFRQRKKKTLTKNEKIRYIDSLTSLKNRAYLNDNIEKWDNSEVYPQIIIIVDLNNVAYINDNFGHEEGDKVIAEAANILIQNQMPKSEIIRTDGNEFLIYLVEYEEKQATAYIRKLHKEFKELSHGFGAAIGYSVINDAIKTIDDAVNEATLDMRTNKEAMMEEEK